MSKEFFCRDRDVYQAWIWDGTFKDAPEWVKDAVQSGRIREGLGWSEGDYPGEPVLVYDGGHGGESFEYEVAVGDVILLSIGGTASSLFFSHWESGSFFREYEIIPKERVREAPGHLGYKVAETAVSQEAEVQISFLQEQNNALQTRVKQQGKALDFLLNHVSKNLKDSKEILSAFGVEEREEDEDLGEE